MAITQSEAAARQAVDKLLEHVQHDLTSAARETLDISGPILSAHILRDPRVLLTRSRTRQGADYAARIDVWNLLSGQHIGQLPRLFDTQVKLAVNTGNSRIATVSRTDKGHRVELWDLASLASIWSAEQSAPVESVTFRERDMRVATVGQDEDRHVVMVDYDAATGAVMANEKDVLRPGSTHVIFSAEGDHLIGDYDYASVLIWSIRQRSNIATPIEFSDAGGVPFDLGYDIVKGLRNIRLENSVVTGELSGPTAVRFVSEGPGTTIVPLSDNTPILSAFQRSNLRFYPVRDSQLVSSNGRWFALATVTSGIELPLRCVSTI
jgi:hypothetical protein